MLANTERLGLEVLAAVLEPPAPIDLLAWAEAHVVFDDGPFQGPYNRNLFPFFDAILRALGPEDPCRYVTRYVERSSRQDNARQYFLFGLDNLAERELSRRASDKRLGRSMVKDEARADDAVNPGRERAVPATA